MADVAAKERKILVAVDEGEESMHALSWCLKNVISKNSKDTLVLLYVKPPRPVFSALDGTGYLFSADIMAAVDKYSNDLAECVVEKAKMMCKDLHDMTEKLGADVLVMGAMVMPNQKALLGSVSNHCAQNVKCPVLIVKKPKSTATNN
ncbi:hypothetical protein CFP56_016913 [Quercus suber]|uniref:UspA domain-containing protein n=1 Tax=Quercus suber TaxID=58331 RepID=A0AAW0KQF5_QUESU